MASGDVGRSGLVLGIVIDFKRLSMEIVLSSPSFLSQLSLFLLSMLILINSPLTRCRHIALGVLLRTPRMIRWREKEVDFLLFSNNLKHDL